MILNLIIFIAVFSILVLSHEFGHFISAKLSGMKVEEFGVGFPPKLFSFKKGETVYSINAIPLGGFVKILGEDGDENEDEKRGDVIKKEDLNRSFSSKPIWQRVIVLSAGVIMNFVLGFLLFIPVFMNGIPNQIIVSKVMENSPAYTAGIKLGDIIVGFDNQNEFINYLQGNAGKEMELRVRRGDQEINVKVTPYPKGENKGRIGVLLSSGGIPKRSFFTAVKEAFIRSVTIFSFIFIMLFKLIVSIFTGGDLFSQVSGPVGIFKATSAAVNIGWVYLLSFIALISINLAALNIFPFPALDGGRIVFLIAEKLKGAPISKKVQQITNAVGFVLLIVLLIFATVQDIFYR